MLPIVDKPIIQFLVEEAVASGITEVIFVTGRGKRAIEDHFDYAYELEQVLAHRGKKEPIRAIREISNLASFVYVRQKNRKETATRCLPPHISSAMSRARCCLAMTLSTVKVPCLQQMMGTFEKYNDPVIALEEVKEEETPLYGIVDTAKVGDRVHEIKHIVEKPALGKRLHDSP